MKKSIPLESLRSAVDADALIEGDAASKWTVDGCAPSAMVCPGSIEQLSAIMRIAHEHRLAVAPWGCGARTALGNPPARLDLVVSLERMNRVLEYNEGDMTIRAQAGLTLSALNEQAAQHRQFLPVDPPEPDATSLGGLCATNIAGPRRYGSNAFRNYLIGIKVVMTDGRITKAGGMVVKNVTGFDLMKLYCGSLGTLAVIAEVNLKLRPLPAEERTCCAVFADRADACRAGERMIDSYLLPNSLMLLPAGTARDTGAPARDDGWTLLASYDGFPATIESELRDTDKICSAEKGAFTVLDAETGATVRTRLRDYPSLRVLDRAVIRATMPATACDRFYTGLESLELWPDLRAVTYFGNGVHKIILPDISGRPDGAVIAWLQAVSNAASQCGGRMMVEQAPVRIKTQFPVWGPPSNDWNLMRRLKKTFDPENILNPGRFVGGI